MCKVAPVFFLELNKYFPTRGNLRRVVRTVCLKAFLIDRKCMVFTNLISNSPRSHTFKHLVPCNTYSQYHAIKTRLCQLATQISHYNVHPGKMYKNQLCLTAKVCCTGLGENDLNALQHRFGSSKPNAWWHSSSLQSSPQKWYIDFKLSK